MESFAKEMYKEVLENTFKFKKIKNNAKYDLPCLKYNTKLFVCLRVLEIHRKEILYPTPHTRFFQPMQGISMQQCNKDKRRRKVPEMCKTSVRQAFA